LAFDLAKTLVESACKTILNERSVTYALDDDLPKLFKTVTNCLPLLPATASGEVQARKSLAQTLNGLHTALQGVCELRNACGFASHGSAGPRPIMESVQALLVAQTADAIVGFLHRVHRQERPSDVKQFAYDEQAEFNDYLDENNEIVRIFWLEYQPSEVLFSVDQEAYRDLLTEFSNAGDTSEPEAEDDPGGGQT
jgi:Abortive infection C-terminus